MDTAKQLREMPWPTPGLTEAEYAAMIPAIKSIACEHALHHIRRGDNSAADEVFSGAICSLRYIAENADTARPSTIDLADAATVSGFAGLGGKMSYQGSDAPSPGLPCDVAKAARAAGDFLAYRQVWLERGERPS